MVAPLIVGLCVMPSNDEQTTRKTKLRLNKKNIKKEKREKKKEEEEEE
jgi:hypothetical protein